ncbi:MAG TPA: DUF362 domain-containing protein [Anaerolinea thermolimosa]|uniref:DUF362 domain-containing protein n=1 Tax=Anaerolinea thermolimosa TaxID=229919 RepID=A0A3D1JHH8_9CHLR|nr:DUF362 domain-containing protein [Anaerolinea thermolimosa]GAP07148.1 uncharacterized Fe-S center protein [Anaerolinea thermolimosa]HCE18030.1 DUF362 domain-containing protein [Anaerolinea thermolimosa]
MASKVFWGSPRQAKLDANETLPAKLDLILEQLHLRDRVKDELVVLKMHTGSNIGYSTVHPLFVRKVVDAIKEGGGQPVVADIEWDVKGAERRGYTSETLGCPIYPAAGLKENYFYPHHRPYKNIEEWHLAGAIQDATFLVNFAHAKGHPSCGYGGAIKNLALGCMAGKTRSAMHDAMHFDPYWFPEKCPDPAVRKAIIESCPFGAIVQDRENESGLHLHFEGCNQCGRCLQVAPPGSLKIDPVNFHTFQEACAISTSITLSTFEPGKAVHLVLATHMTPVCDCFGFTSMPILRDAGIFGSDDIVALEQAVLDETAKYPLIEENIPTSMEVHTRVGHPLRWLHGPYKDPYKVVEYAEKLGLGTREYELVDVLPVASFQRTSVTYIPAS